MSLLFISAFACSTHSSRSSGEAVSNSLMISEEALDRGGVEGSSLDSLTISEMLLLRKGLTGSFSNPLLMSGALLRYGSIEGGSPTASLSN